MKKRLLDDLKEAMKEKNEIKKNAIQMVRAGILQIEKDKGIEVDDNGLPYLNDKEVMAIATYVAWIQKYKEGLQTNNPQIMQIAQQLEQRWRQQCDEARCPEELSQNDMDEIADAKSSWDRKVYGKSYFPLIK